MVTSGTSQWQYRRMSATTPPKINRWPVFAEAIKSWPTTLRFALLGLAWSPRSHS
jgi:hypothetical protein